MSGSVGRPSGRKPLLNLRVPQPLFDELKVLAELRGVTVSEEAVRQLERLMPKSKRSVVTKPLVVRLPIEVHEELTTKAKRRGLSINNLIVDRCS